MKLGLGTVQFGLDYGITNAGGQTSATEAAACLAFAAQNAVPVVDTAALYGNAESVLGASLPRPHDFRIVGKTLALDPTLPSDAALKGVVAGVFQSLEHLREQSLDSLLIHRVDDLLGPQGDALYGTLSRLRDDGLFRQLGVSIYSPAEAFAILERYPVDIVQLPLSPLDQRHPRAGSLAALAEAGVEIHVRSVFLQGLLLAEPGALPAGLGGLQPALDLWHALLRRESLTPLAGCFAFLRSLPHELVAICGATRLDEWRAIVAAHHAAARLPAEKFKNLAVADDKLIDPRFWPKR